MFETSYLLTVCFIFRTCLDCDIKHDNQLISQTAGVVSYRKNRIGFVTYFHFHTFHFSKTGTSNRWRFISYQDIVRFQAIIVFSNYKLSLTCHQVYFGTMKDLPLHTMKEADNSPIFTFSEMQNYKKYRSN